MRLSMLSAGKSEHAGDGYMAKIEMVIDSPLPRSREIPAWWVPVDGGPETLRLFLWRWPKG